MDEVDPIPHNYYLEVSSPGADRPLKKEQDYKNAVGKNVHIKTYEPIDGEKVFEGILKDFDGEYVTIEIKVKTRRKDVQIPMKKIAFARLAVAI